jgi:hypothetical protein
MLYSQQPPGIEWAKCYGGINTEDAASIIRTFDGGYAFTGSTNSNDGDVSGKHGGAVNQEVWMVKLNSNGTIQWQKCLGGTNDDSGQSILQTTDGGYAIGGITSSNDGDITNFRGGTDYWVVRLNSEGGLLWQQCLGGTGSDVAYSLIQTFDKGFAIAGYSGSVNGDVTGNHGAGDVWVVKLDTLGNIEWQKCFGGSGFERAYSIIQTMDSGYAFAGETTSSNGDVGGHLGGYDAWVVKLNSAGVIEWQKCIGGTGDDGAYSLLQTSDGYVIAGYTGSTDGDISGNHGAADAFVAKLTSAGSIAWLKCFGRHADDIANSIIKTSDGGYAFAGVTLSGPEGLYHGGEDVWVVKLNATGEEQWEKFLGGSDFELGQSIANAGDGGYIICGQTTSNNFDVSGNHYNGDAWVVKLAPLSGVQENSTFEQLSLSAYPNPTANIITLGYDLLKAWAVGITIYSVTGERMKEIRQTQEESGHHEAALDLGGFAEGTYFISVSACGLMERRMVQKLSEP